MRNVAYIPLDEPLEEEIEEVAPPDFHVGDTCTTTAEITDTHGKIGEGTIVEIKKRTETKKGLMYDIETLPCKSCLTIIKMWDVPIEQLQDYEVTNPYTQ